MMHRFRAALLRDSVARSEDAQREWKDVRRAALRVLEMDSEALNDAIADVETAEAMFWLYQQIKDCIAWHKAEGELLETASTRLLEVLSDRIETIGNEPQSQSPPKR